MGERLGSDLSLTQENGERPQFNLDQWAAGFFEVSSWWGIHVKRCTTKGKQVVRAVPEIRISTHDPQTTGQLMELLEMRSGGKDKRRNQSQTLVLQNRRAVDLAHRIKPYSPFRQEIIDYFEWWEEVKGEARLAMMEVYKEHCKSARQIAKEEYVSLVCIPSFVAGVLDARGYMVQNVKFRPPSHDYVSTGLAVSATNLPLLAALHDKFYGAKPFQPKSKYKSSYTWQLGQSDYKNLMDFVYPCLQIRSNISS